MLGSPNGSATTKQRLVASHGDDETSDELYRRVIYNGIERRVLSYLHETYPPVP